MRLGQCLGLIGQMSDFCLALATLDPEVPEFPEHTPAFFQQFPQFTLEMASANLVLTTSFKLVVCSASGSPCFGFHGHQIGLGCTHCIFRNGKVAHGCSLPFMRST